MSPHSSWFVPVSTKMATAVMTKAARISEAGPVTGGHRKLIRGFVDVGSNLAGATTSTSRTDRTSPFKRASLRTGWPGVLATWVICSQNKHLQHDLTSPPSLQSTTPNALIYNLVLNSCSTNTASRSKRTIVFHCGLAPQRYRIMRVRAVLGERRLRHARLRSRCRWSTGVCLRGSPRCAPPGRRARGAAWR